MLRIPAFFCLFIFITAAAIAQPTISGKVVNAATNQPIAGTSVFISNTSFGTVSSRDGSFELKDIPPGKYDLIISSIGFETNVYSFSTDKLPLRLRIEMNEKVKELENVTIEPSLEEGWDKWGRVFMENFVGESANAKQCKIKNEKSIRFRFYKKSNRLVAFCDEPIVLENKALGYIIRYQLEDFEINYKKNSTLFAGYPLFEEIDKGRKGVQRRWQRNRDKAFYGSMMHFMRAVYTKSLAAEGYEVRRMVRTPNYEKQRVKQIYRAMPKLSSGAKISISSSSGINRIPVPQNDSSFAADSIEYYERILRQKDDIDTYGRDLLTADSLIVEQDDALKVMFFENYLYITYKKELEEEGYLLYHHEQRQPTFQRSYIWLQNQQAIAIDANGSYYPPQEVFSMAYWGWGEKIANLLPLDYKPYSIPESKFEVK
ncbi:MAG: hypothetical protein DI535_13730 [Citrobacter freundii]|nr:MAG: hypothetical protein DI535_13730 [Citrobacter freundii]